MADIQTPLPTDPVELVKKLTVLVKEKLDADTKAATPDPGEKDNLKKAVEDILAAKAQADAERKTAEHAKQPAEERKGLFEEKGPGFKLSYKAMLERPAMDEQSKRIQDLNDDVYLVSQMTRLHPSQFKGERTRSLAQELKSLVETKASPLYSTLAGSGDEWVPTGWSEQIFKTMELFGTVEPLFVNIRMPRDPYKLPVQTARATAYLHTEPTSNAPAKYTASGMTTDDMTLTTKLLAVRTVFTDIYDEDGLAAQLPMVKADLARALEYGVERAIMDGDDNGTHLDTGDAPVSPDVRVAWDGLRFMARLVEDAQGVATMIAGGGVPLTSLIMNRVRSCMGKYAARPSELAWILGPQTWIQLMRDTSIQTMDKYGPNATIINGELGKHGGIPIVVTELAREELNSTAYYDNSVVGQSCPILVNHRQFVVGTRREVKIASQPIFATDASEVCATRRATFMPMEDVIKDVSGSGAAAHGVTPIGCVNGIDTDYAT